MQIEGQEVTGFQLRCRQLKWFLDCWNGGNDTGLSYGPFTYVEAMRFIRDNEEQLRDMDKEMTRAKVEGENTQV